MANPKDILVLTTSTVDGLKVKKYLKPVSAHIIAGTNLFSDFFASLSDIFGGRSGTYQKQLTSLYNEAIERVKYAAYEIGANCIVGLSIDMDEISGKGKSMFMLTAVGTAVIIEKEVREKVLPKSDEKLENVGVDRINVLRSKRAIIEKANSGTLTLNDDIWNFITTNQVDEVFPFLLNKFQDVIANEQIPTATGATEKYYTLFIGYIDALPEDKKINLLYSGIAEQNEKIALKLSAIIKELNLFDFNRSMELLKSDNFQIQKRGIRIVTYDKPFYNKQDIQDLQNIRNYIQETFTERGTRATKKQLFSSKEKEVWTCECGKTNDINTYCSGCGQDIYGFKRNETKPNTAINHIEQKIDLITEYLK